MPLESVEQSPYQWEIICGSDSILQQKGLLIELAKRCAREGVFDFLDYLIDEPYFTLHVPRFGSWNVPPFLRSFATRREKRPRLLLRRDSSGVNAAVLLFEYALLGVGTRCFIPFEEDGYRSVIAPEQERAEVALHAGEFLIKQGAILALISYMAEHPGAAATDTPVATRLIGFQSRDVRRKLSLATSYEETLATMSRNTRHNLRRSRDQLTRLFGARYSDSFELSDEEIRELNRDSSYAPPFWAARQRYVAARTFTGGVLAGIMGADGRWLSLIGAHKEHDTLCLDWQVNRASLGTVSVATAARAFLIEAQAKNGTKQLRFERGTTHPIQGAFLPEKTYDLIFAPKLLPAWLIRTLFTDAKGGLLPTILASPSLVWRR